MAYVASAWPIILKVGNFQPVVFLMMWKKHGTGPLRDLLKPIHKKIIYLATVVLFILCGAALAGKADFEKSIKVRILTAHKLSGRTIAFELIDHLAILDGRTISFSSHVLINFGERLCLRGDGVELVGNRLVIIPNRADSYLPIFHGSLLFGKYPGKVTFEKEGKDWTAINRVPLEYYVASVVSAEAGEKESDYLKVMSIVVRTRALSKPPHDKRTFCDRTCCMVYRGNPDSKSMEGALRTRGQVISHDKKLCPVYFHACCGGKTSPVEKGIAGASVHSALVGMTDVDSKGKPWCVKSRNYRWKREISDTDFHPVTLGFLKARSLGEAEHPLSFRRSEKSELFLIYGQRREIEINKRDFRLYLGRKLGWNYLLSNSFDMELRGSDYHFSGKGFGHGVGLCQAGALARIKTGHSIKDVIRAYFPGTEITQH